MTNYEKNKEQLDMYAVSQAHWSVDKDGKISGCTSCADCIFNDGRGSCSQKRINWLQQEYEEVDWSKVEIDTPILVRDDEYSEWENVHFAGYICGIVCAFDGEHTSKNFNFVISWKYAKLAEQGDD